MFRNTFVSGFVSLFFSLGSKPLELWHVVKGEGGSVGLVRDEELESPVLELRDANVSTTRIECPPASRDTLDLGLNFLVLLVKNMDAFFTLEVEVADDSGKTRRFRCSNFQSDTRIRPEMTTFPLVLEPGWNTLTLDLPSLVQRAYGTQYRHLEGVIVHANTRIRRIYLARELVAEDNLPLEFRLFHK